MANRLELSCTKELHGMPGALHLHQREPTQLATSEYVHTFSKGSGVLRMRTAHCMSVVGGFSGGTRGWGSFGVEWEIER